jgi:hypothetical protein
MDKPVLRILGEPSDGFEKFYLRSTGIKIVPVAYNGCVEKVLHRDSGSFAKWICKNHTDINIEYDPSAKKISLHNNEFWLPLVYLASDTSAQIYIGLVTNFIYDKLKGVLSRERNKAKVNFSFEYKDGDKHKAFNYSGSVEGLEKFNTIDINKFFEE